MFDCEELPVGKHWDGHTEEDVTRLFSLPVTNGVQTEELISRRQAINALDEWGWDNRDDRDAIDVINGLPTILPERKECEEREQGKCPWYAG